MTAGGRGEPAELADRGLLRRLELVAVGWTVVGAASLLVAGSAAGAVVLTAASAASIVAFRGLQRIIAAIGPRDETRDPTRTPRAAQPPPQNEKPAAGERGEGRGRPALAALVRLALLGALLVAGSFLLDPGLFPALVLGFSTLPAAIMTEGLLQAVRALRGKDHDPHDVP